MGMHVVWEWKTKLFEETVEWKERKGGGSIGCRRCRAPALQAALVNPRCKGFMCAYML